MWKVNFTDFVIFCCCFHSSLSCVFLNIQHKRALCVFLIKNLKPKYYRFQCKTCFKRFFWNKINSVNYQSRLQTFSKEKNQFLTNFLVVSNFLCSCLFDSFSNWISQTTAWHKNIWRICVSFWIKKRKKQ